MVAQRAQARPGVEDQQPFAAADLQTRCVPAILDGVGPDTRYCRARPRTGRKTLPQSPTRSSPRRGGPPRTSLPEACATRKVTAVTPDELGRRHLGVALASPRRTSCSSCPGAAAALDRYAYDAVLAGADVGLRLAAWRCPCASAGCCSAARRPSCWASPASAPATPGARAPANGVVAGRAGLRASASRWPSPGRRSPRSTPRRATCRSPSA